MTELEKYITNYFGVSEKNALEGISSLFQYTAVKKGEFLQEQGKHCNTLGFVLSGYQRFYALVDGKEVTQWISHQGTSCSPGR